MTTRGADDMDLFPIRTRSLADGWESDIVCLDDVGHTYLRKATA
jgi:hypothetical protein